METPTDGIENGEILIGRGFIGDLAGYLLAGWQHFQYFLQLKAG